MRHRRLLAALLPALLIGGALPPGIALAQPAEDLEGVTLTLDPVGEEAVSGLAVLAPRGGDTAANVLAVGAPAGAMAVIHAGTCAAIDPTPVGLLGDVGTTGQLAATVPVAFASIADGAHVVAIHPGLDLSTTIACGAIPRAAAQDATAAPGASSAPGATSFVSPTYGFSIDWDDPWRRLDFQPGEGYEGLVLGNGTSQVTIVATRMEPADATRCIRDWEGRLLELLRSGIVSDLQPMVDEQGQPMGGGDAQRATGAYRFLYKTQTDPEGSVIIERDDCRRTADSVVLEVTVDIPADAHDTQAPLVEALIGRLATTVTPSRSTAPATPAAATPGPTAVGTPPPTPVPAPTVDPACAGLDVWVRDTLARYAQLKAIADDVAVAMNSGMQVYAQALGQATVSVQQIQIAQQQQSVPSAAKDVQADIIKAFSKLAEAYDLMSQAYATGNTGLLQQGLNAASEAQATATSAIAAMRRVATPCNITVPAA